MVSKKCVVIIAPFWSHDGHVGNNRLERFVRWLSSNEFSIVIVRAGSTGARCETEWGTQITVRDALGLYRDADRDRDYAKRPLRRPNRFRRALAYWLFNPDPTVVWSRAVAKDPFVREATQGAAFILSSSPPESVHVGAWLLSKRSGVPHLVDMRDGWLDEPLKPILQGSLLRRWQEGRLEKRILQDAAAIQVTSDKWKALLVGRYRSLAPRISVLTNGYPLEVASACGASAETDSSERTLIYAGRFTGSRVTQRPRLLLEPLLVSLAAHCEQRGTVRLVGALSDSEVEDVAKFQTRFAEIGWVLQCKASVPRRELLAMLQRADGLLLLSASMAAIPSKLFEYLPTGNPIFVVTERDSATWDLCTALPQVTLVPIPVSGAQFEVPTRKWLSTSEDTYIAPYEYSDRALGLQFLKTCGDL